MNLWAPNGNGEGAKCLEILQQQSEQQSEPFSRTNKLFISSSTPEFRENCIKKLSAPVERLGNKIYYNHLVTLKLQLFTSIYVKFGRKVPFNNRTTRPRRDQMSEKLMSLPADHFFNGCSR